MINDNEDNRGIQDKLHRNINKLEKGAVEERILSEKECFFVLDRGIIKKNDEGINELKYYPSDDDEVIEYIPLSKIKTQSSENDDIMKYKLLRFSGYRIFAGLLGTLLLCITYGNLNYIKSFLVQNDFSVLIDSVLLITVFLIYSIITDTILHARFVSIKTELDVNFTRMTNQWATSIAELLGHDIHGRIFGIRACMLEFRRFIKWRRFGSIYNTIFNWIFYPIALIYFGVLYGIYALCLQILGLDINLSNINIQDIILFIILTSFYLYPLWRVRRIRSFLTNMIMERTKFRDPTVQLAVMVSEMHQRFVQRKMA